MRAHRVRALERVVRRQRAADDVRGVLIDRVSVTDADDTGVERGHPPNQLGVLLLVERERLPPGAALGPRGDRGRRRAARGARARRGFGRPGRSLEHRRDRDPPGLAGRADALLRWPPRSGGRGARQRARSSAARARSRRGRRRRSIRRAPARSPGKTGSIVDPFLLEQARRVVPRESRRVVLGKPKSATWSPCRWPISRPPRRSPSSGPRPSSQRSGTATTYKARAARSALFIRPLDFSRWTRRTSGSARRSDSHRRLHAGRPTNAGAVEKRCDKSVHAAGTSCSRVAVRPQCLPGTPLTVRCAGSPCASWSPTYARRRSSKPVASGTNRRRPPPR
jgi:hypothetical protein